MAFVSALEPNRRAALLIGLVMLLAGLLGAPVHAGSQQTYLDCLVDFEPYAEANWHTASYSNAPADSGYFGDGASGGNGGIRASGGASLAYAVLAEALPAASNRAARLTKVRQALNYLANTHVSGTNVCWILGWALGDSLSRSTS